MATPPLPDNLLPADDTRRRLVVRLGIVGLLLSIGALLLLVFRLLPTGVPGQWQWPWRASDYYCPPQICLVLLLHLAVLALLLRRLQRPSAARGPAAAFVALCCLSAALSIAVLETTEPVAPLHLALTTASLPATGYFSYATVLKSPHEAFSALSGREGPSMPPRVQTHPPGPVLFYYYGLKTLERLPGLTAAVERDLDARYGLTPQVFHSVARYTSMPSVQPHHLAPAIILGLLLTMLGGLLPLPVYWLVRQLATPHAALIAAGCATTLPSVLVFIPGIDGVAAVLTVLALATWLWALTRGGWWRSTLAGLAACGAIFWSLGLLAVSVPMLAAAWPGLRRSELRRPTRQAVLLAGGTFVALFVALYLAVGYSLPGNMKVAVAWQSVDIAHAERSYALWLPWNLYDTALFMGPGMLLVALAGLWCLRPASATARLVTVGGWVALGLVWLSGSTLGEVGRIWSFLMALLLPGAALALDSLEPTTQRRVLSLLLLSQSALALMLHCRLTLVAP